MAIDPSTHDWQQHALRAKCEIEALEAERDRWYGKAIEWAGWRQSAEWAQQRIRAVEAENQRLRKLLSRWLAAEHDGHGPGDDLIEDTADMLIDETIETTETPQHSEAEQQTVDAALTALDELADAAMSDDDLGRNERVSTQQAVAHRYDRIRQAIQRQLLSDAVWNLIADWRARSKDQTQPDPPNGSNTLDTQVSSLQTIVLRGAADELEQAIGRVGGG